MNNAAVMFVFLTASLASFHASTSASASDLSLDSDLGGVASIYTGPLLQTLQNLVKGSTASLSQAAPGVPISLTCWQTPGNDLYIGVEQAMLIDAPLAQVKAVLGDIDHYQDLFPGYKDIHVTNRSGNLIESYWEQIVPIFFVPNAKFEMIYLVDSSDPSKVAYRYQLKKPRDLKKSDGFILISKAGETKTRYIEYDFFDAEWGAAKLMGKDKIWTDTVEGIAQSDLAIKSKAENPAWGNDKARSDGIRLLQKSWVEDCVKGRKDFAGK